VSVLGVETSEGITTLTMNRADAMNALNEELSYALREALEAAASDSSVRVVVLTGSGRAFSAGADLAEAQRRIEQGGNLAPSEILRKRYNPIVKTIVEMEKPVIAAVNGVAAGAGASLAFACDVRVASDKARFMQAFVKIGLVPDAGATYFLPRLIGYARALEMAITGDLIDATKALEIGLVNAVVEHDQLLDTVRKEWAEPFASGPTRAYGLSKRAMRYGATNALENVLEFEPDLQDQAALTHDAGEGITAFLEKRPPNYRGR